jgi:hypothetical protein
MRNRFGQHITLPDINVFTRRKLSIAVLNHDGLSTPWDSPQAQAHPVTRNTNNALSCHDSSTATPLAPSQRKAVVWGWIQR